METNKFFKFLWRANAIFIFGAAMGAIIIVLLMGVLLLSEAVSYTHLTLPTILLV